MNKILKFSPKGLWFTSDLHLNHVREFVWQTRGFASPEEHREAVIAKINEVVAPTDVLFNLGDMFLNSKEDAVEDVLGRIKCQTIYYIFGNHENPLQRIHRSRCLGLLGGEEGEVYPLRYKNLVFLGNYAQIYVGKQPIVMSHYSLYSWNDMKFGGWNLFGHSHGGVNDKVLDSKSIDVGWDNFKGPVSYDEIAELMLDRPTRREGHHE